MATLHKDVKSAKLRKYFDNEFPKINLKGVHSAKNQNQQIRSQTVSCHGERKN